MEVGGWVKVSLGILFVGKSSQHSSKPVFFGIFLTLQSLFVNQNTKIHTYTTEADVSSRY